MTTFTAQRQDLGTIRFARSPAWETMQAVRLLIDPRGRSYHQPWHATARHAPNDELAPLFAVSPLKGWVPDFLSPPPHVPAPTLQDQLTEIRATPAGQVSRDLVRCHRTVTGRARETVAAMLPNPEGARDALADLVEWAWQELVAPFWPDIEALINADVAYRSRQLADRGLRPMLEGIDPRITWREDGVHLADKFPDTVDLRGRGLVLMPSAFSWPLVIAISAEPWQPTIAYPARGIAGLWEKPPPAPGALVKLLGRTRATLLASLDRPASTTALAQRHGMSPAGASRHLIALRDAGLVAGSRHGHEVRYARTRLGGDLIRSATSPKCQDGTEAGNKIG
jgi:DNA-binding transcriptional ArsR family regulator